MAYILIINHKFDDHQMAKLCRLLVFLLEL